MARKRKHSILVYGPAEAARRTIEHLRRKYDEARNNPEARREWVNNYFEHIGEYVENPSRTAEAEKKLETWYETLEHEVAPEYAKVMAKAKAEYYRRLAEKLSETSGYSEWAEREEEI